MNPEQLTPPLDAQERRYDQTMRRIEDEIRRGSLLSGSRLLGERDLSRVLGVSRVTVRRALGELKARGLVASNEARGWFVAEAAVTERSVLRSFTELARLRGLAPSSRTLARSTRVASITEAEVMGLSHGTPLFEITRVRLMAQDPIAIETSRVPLHLCPALAEADLNAGSLHALLGAAGCGPKRADYAITAVNADDAQSGLLGVPVGAALLKSEAIARDAENRVAELSTSYFRADRYVFSTSLRTA
jgi:GntR family transcriptional regulator